MKLFHEYSWIVIFLPLVFGILYFRTFPKAIKYFFYFVAFGTLTEIVIRAAYNWFKVIDSFMPFGHVYIPLSFLLAGMFYRYELEGYINKKVISGIVLIFEIFAILNVLLIQGFYSYPSYSGTAAALILVGFSVLLFAKIMAEGKIKKLKESPVIWLNSAVLIYYTSNFFYYMLFNILSEYLTEFLTQTILIFRVFNILFYVLIAIGFWKAKNAEGNNI
jgi:hypothetical protein